jgi:hypothetical protein
VNDEVIEAKVVEDPPYASAIEAATAIARHNMSRCREGSKEFAYWTGMFDGLETAFKLMKEKNE